MNAPAQSGIKDPPASFWGILRSIGPGLILTANIVGTGELIVTTRLGAQVGFLLLWFILFSCCIKVFVQVELGRFAIVEGVGSLVALDRLPGPRARISWAVWLWIIMYLGTICQMAGMVGGIAEIFVQKSQSYTGHLLWAAATAGVCALLLAVGRYGIVESLSTVMVALFTISNLVAVALLQTTEWRMTGADVAEGFRFAVPKDLVTAFAAFGITGVGAAELVFYPLWCLEKGYARAVGPRDDSPQWEGRARGWMRVMRTDAWLSMVVYTVATVSFYILGAAILHRQGKTVEDATAIATLADMYVKTFGSWGLWIFNVGAFMVLFSTFFVSTASNSRLFADVSSMLGVFSFRTPEDRLRVVRWGVILIPVATLFLYLASKGIVTLILIGATGQALMLPILGFAAIYFHRKRIPPALRARSAWTALLFLSFLAMAALGVFQAGDKTGLWRAFGWVR